MDIPFVFKKIIISTYGDTGRAWLEKLPAVISNVSFEWGLDNVTPLQSMSYNFVASANHELYGKTILKIGVPEDIVNREYESTKLIESKVLRKCHMYHQEYNALLLEALEPGSRLSGNGSLEYELQIGCMLLEDLKNENNKQSYLPHYKELIDRAFSLAIENRWGGQVFIDYMDKAYAHYKILEEKYKAKYLTHGDFHGHNVLAYVNTNLEDQWKVIDPKGVINFWFADIGRFILNLIWRSAKHDIIKSTRNLIFHAADFLHLPFSAVYRILFIETVLCYAWKFQEQTDEDRYLNNVKEMQRDISLILTLDNKRL